MKILMTWHWRTVTSAPPQNKNGKKRTGYARLHRNEDGQTGYKRVTYPFNVYYLCCKR